MNAPAAIALACPPAAALEQKFLSLLPRIRMYVEFFFRHIRCSDQKEEYLAESIALAWSSFVGLEEKGTDTAAFVSALAVFAAKRAYSGRRLTGQEKAKDVLSPRAQRRHGFAVMRLHGRNGPERLPWQEALQDNSISPVPEQAAFRCDFADWYESRSLRDQQLMEAFMMGERNGAVAAKFGLSPGRISQLRRSWQQDWNTWCCCDNSPASSG
jgi:hypothetical protein